MATLSIKLVGDPSNGNLWSVLGTVTPTPITVNEYYVRFYVNNILYRTERASPYAIFGDDTINPTLSRLTTDGTYQIRIEAWNTTQTILHDTKTITITQTQSTTLTFIRTIKIIGNGSVNITKNGVFVGTATSTNPITITANLGDSYSRTISSGTIVDLCLNDVCGSTDYNGGTLGFIPSHVLTQEFKYIFESDYTFTRTIKIVQGNGTVNVYKNGTFVGIATPTSQYILTANIGDSYSVTGVPDTGYIFEKVCTDVPESSCTYEITSGTTSFNLDHIISHTKEFYFKQDCQSSICDFTIIQ